MLLPNEHIFFQIQDLVTDLKEKLSNHFQEVIVGLMYPPAFFDAYQLRNAMKGIGTDENCLIEILASRTNDEINAINEVYLMQFDVPIQFDVESETSGHFRDALVILTQVFCNLLIWYPVCFVFYEINIVP
ncbi:hypothetical protein scyTo_0021590 [Scyliorhinus torazame]|uniref:Annexin n=1 Tax=Scyliorhinus torazame TaxID=75743 RepID=A0A401QAE3_SCYTO|nr:hypothetical protein [Scyliorhinus torazame]